jgi:hypothetical protein
MTVDFCVRECGIKVLGMEASMSRYVVASWQLRVRAFAALGRGGFTPTGQLGKRYVTGCQARSSPARYWHPLTIASLTRGIGHMLNIWHSRK